MHHTKLFLLAFFAILFSVTIQSAQLPAPLNVVLPSPQTPLAIVDSRVKLYGHEIYLKNPYNFSYRDEGSGPTITKLLQTHSSLVFFLGQAGPQSICRPAATLVTPTDFNSIGFFAIQEHPLNHITVIPFGSPENMFYFAKICGLLNGQGLPLNPGPHLNYVLDLILPVKLAPKIPPCLVDVAVQSLLAPKATRNIQLDTADLLRSAAAMTQTDTIVIEKNAAEVQTEDPEHASVECQTPASWIFAQHVAAQAIVREPSNAPITHVIAEPVVTTTDPTEHGQSDQDKKKKKRRSKKQSQGAAADSSDSITHIAPDEHVFTQVKHGARNTPNLLGRAFDTAVFDQQEDDNETDTQSETSIPVASKKGSIQSSPKRSASVAAVVRVQSAHKQAENDDTLLTHAQLENDLARQSLLYPLYSVATSLIQVVKAPGHCHIPEDNAELLDITNRLKSTPHLYRPDLEKDVVEPYKKYLIHVLGYLLATNKIGKPLIEREFREFLGDDYKEVLQLSKNFPLSSPTPTPSPAAPHAPVTDALRAQAKTMLLTRAAQYPTDSLFKILHACRDLMTVADIPTLLQQIPEPQENTYSAMLLRQVLKNIVTETYRKHYKTAPCAATLQPLYSWCLQRNENSNTSITHLESILLLGNILGHDEAISLPTALDHLSMDFKEHPHAELTPSQQLEQCLFDTFRMIAQGASLEPNTKALKATVKRITNSDAIDELEKTWNNTCTLFSHHLPLETARPFLRSFAQTLHEQLVTKKENQQGQQLCVVLKLACCKEEKQQAILKTLENYLIELFKDRSITYTVKNRILFDTIHQVHILSTLSHTEQGKFVVTLQKAIAQYENDFYTAHPLTPEENNRLFFPEKFSPFLIDAIHLSDRKFPWLRGHSKRSHLSYSKFITSSDYRQNINTEIRRTLKECGTEVQENHHWSIGYALFETLAYLNTYQSVLSFPEGNSRKNIQETVTTIQGLFRILPPRLQTLLFLSNTTLWKKYLNL